LGEEVEVTLEDFQVLTPGKAPRAIKVIRHVGPPALFGKVETFDPQRGYGFVKGDDGLSYHLHSSEILDKRITRPGQGVMFFAGIRNDRPRACHVKVCP
jgi:cold shock CspA family protein